MADLRLLLLPFFFRLCHLESLCRFGQVNLDRDGEKPAVSDAVDRGRKRFAGET
jgi:hypothetical protein